MAINGATHKTKALSDLETKTYNLGSDNKFRHIITILHKLNHKAPGIYEQLGTDLLFDIKMVTTDKNNRKAGLGTELLKRSVELAGRLGYKACKTEATGKYNFSIYLYDANAMHFPFHLFYKGFLNSSEKKMVLLELASINIFFNLIISKRKKKHMSP